MTTLWQDLRYALRMLAKSPGFTAVAVVTLALGIGANTAIFSVIYGVLFRALPYRDSQLIEQVERTYRGSLEESSFTYAEYQFLKEHCGWCDSLAAFTPNGFNLIAGEEAERVNGLHVSADFLRVLGITPLLGRDFLPEEDRPGGTRVVLLSHALWKRRFSDNVSALGSSLSLDGQAYTIIGVMPAEFASRSPVDWGVPPELAMDSPIDVWVPLALVAKTVGSGQNLAILGRRLPGVSHSRAASAIDALTDSYLHQLPYPLEPGVRLTISPFQKMIAARISNSLFVLLGAVAFVLFIACANVASLLISRGASRRKEIAVRTALGASRSRLLRQLLTESAVLFLLGGLAGILLARWSLSSLLALARDRIPRVGEIHVDMWALAFTAGLSLLTGFLFGLMPALHAESVDFSDALRSSAGRATTGLRSARFRRILVVSQFSLALVLLVGAALLTQTFGNLMHANAGFDPRKLLAAEIWLTGSRYKSTPDLAGFYERLLERITALPGVEHAALVSADVPFRRVGNIPVAVNGVYRNDVAGYHVITPDYFGALGVAVLRGRAFTRADAPEAESVAIVNEAFVRAFLGPLDPLATFVTPGHSDGPRRIVGVAANVKSYVGEAPPPTVFVPASQANFGITMLFDSWFPTHLLVRTSGDPLLLANAVERELCAADPQIPVGRVRSMEQLLAASLAAQEFLMALLGLFAGLALVLSAVGIYGVLAHSVAQRTQEIGIRIALGAQPREVLAQILSQGLRLALIGIAAGVAGGLALTRFLSAMLFGVTPGDPATFAGGAVLLLAVGLSACYFPARRATRVDPMVALRYE